MLIICPIDKLKKDNLPLDKFINFSLYDKYHGYYMRKNKFGKKGDFITAPNVSRLFSEMIAIWIISFWKSLGSPKRLNIIELGAGNRTNALLWMTSTETFYHIQDVEHFVWEQGILFTDYGKQLVKDLAEIVDYKEMEWA